MVVTGNIKKIMYMGKEISDVRHTDTIVWQKQTVKPHPPPKPCQACQTTCEKSHQSASCSTACERSGQYRGQGCSNCLRICQDNNQISDS